MEAFRRCAFRVEHGPCLHRAADGHVDDLPTGGRPGPLRTRRRRALQYAALLVPASCPVFYDQKADAPGALIELVKNMSGGQTLFSESHPGVARGNHFHKAKVERFEVPQGDVSVRIRRLFDMEVVDFCLTSEAPSFVDIPTLYPHNPTKVGATTLVMGFRSNEIFDPERPDTGGGVCLKDVSP